jgi:hypothetical protein
VAGEPGEVTAEVIAAAGGKTKVANVDFAVPYGYTIGERFPTWEEAAACARSKIQRFEYPGQAVNDNSDDYHPRRHFREGGTLVVCSRAFVDIRVTGPAGDHPLSRWEIFLDGPAETVLPQQNRQPDPDEVPGEELARLLARLVRDPGEAAGPVPGDRHGSYGAVPTWTARAIETAFAEAGWRVTREPGAGG